MRVVRVLAKVNASSADVVRNHASGRATWLASAIVVLSLYRLLPLLLVNKNSKPLTLGT
jgi:hypothetical protein